MCRCVIFVRRARIATSGRALSGASARPIIRRQNHDKGLKLIGDAAAAEDSCAQYFLAMLNEVPFQPGGPRSHGTTPGNQRRPVAP
jgi:hypothetical protein